MAVGGGPATTCAWWCIIAPRRPAPPTDAVSGSGMHAEWPPAYSKERSRGPMSSQPPGAEGAARWARRWRSRAPGGVGQLSGAITDCGTIASRPGRFAGVSSRSATTRCSMPAASSISRLSRRPTPRAARPRRAAAAGRCRAPRSWPVGGHAVEALELLGALGLGDTSSSALTRARSRAPGSRRPGTWCAARRRPTRGHAVLDLAHGARQHRDDALGVDVAHAPLARRGAGPA